MNARYWNGRVKALFSFTSTKAKDIDSQRNHHRNPGSKAKTPKNCFVKACKAFFDRSLRPRSRSSCCQCRQRHPPLPPPTPEPTVPYRSESRTLAMANSVRMAGRVLDSLEEQRQLMSRNSTQRSHPIPGPGDIDSGSDMSALPPRIPYRMLDGPDIENIEAYVQGFYELNEYDHEVAHTTLGRSTLASRRPSSRVIPFLPLNVSLASPSALSASLPVHRPLLVTRCKTSSGDTVAFPMGQSTPTTPISVCSTAMSTRLRSPCSTLSRRFSARVGVAHKMSTSLTKTQNGRDGTASTSCGDMTLPSLSMGKEGSMDLKEEYISEEEKRKERQALYGHMGRLRRSRSKLQRLDHGGVESEIRSPNGLANTPKTTTFRNWDRALSSSHGGRGQGDARASPQEIVPRPRGRLHPVEARLDRTEMVVRQIKTCVEGRVALEDRFRRTDRKLREYEDGAQDWEVKYLEMCRGMAQAQATG